MKYKQLQARLEALVCLRLKEEAQLNTALGDWAQAIRHVDETHGRLMRIREQGSLVLHEQMQQTRQGARLQPGLMALLRAQAAHVRQMMTVCEDQLEAAQGQQDVARELVARQQAMVDGLEKQIARLRRDGVLERERGMLADMDDLWLAGRKAREVQHV